MKVLNTNHSKTVTLELSGIELENVKSSWRTLRELLDDEDLTPSQKNSLSTALQVLGLLS